MRRLMAVAAVATATLVHAELVRCQQPRGLTGAHPSMARGDELHARHKPADAFEAYAAVLREQPASYEARWKAAREAIAAGMLAADPEHRKRWFALAAEHAERAVAVNPEDPEGHVQLAGALDCLAAEEGPIRRVELLVKMREPALAALAADSTHAGAHGAYGRWNAEIMRLSGMARFLARRLQGAESFAEASWEKAEQHLRRASALDPERIVHHLELGRLYLDTHRPEQAREALRRALELPARELHDPLYKQQAQEALKAAPPPPGPDA